MTEDGLSVTATGTPLAPVKRLLFLIADEFPTHRADVAALFGGELPRHGIMCDLVAQLGRGAQQDVAVWPAGQAFICARSGHRVKDQIAAFWNDCRCLWRAGARNYDAIQVRDKVFAGVLGLVRARRLKLPFFFWMSFPMSEGFIEIARREGLSLGLTRWAFMSIKGHLGKRLIYRFLLPQCDHVFVQSERMADDLVRHGIRRDRMTVVPMGVDLRELVTEGDGADGMPQEIVGSPVIGYLGSLDRARGLEFLLEALVRVRDRFPDASLLFIGDATEDVDRRWLKAKAEEFNLGGAIVWTGWLPRGNAWEYLRHADIAVSLVPRGELFDVSSPTKVVEYLALGLPVVANDLPDQQEVLSESGAGFSVESKVPEFADAIVRILQDPALSAAMRAAGPPYVRARRSYAVIGARVAEVYSRLLSRSGEPGGK